MRKPPPSGFVRAVAALVVTACAAWTSPPALAREYQVTLRLRHPDGSQETLQVSDFRFVYYDRRYVHYSRGLGKPAGLRIRDLRREVKSIQSEDLNRLKFFKIRKVVFKYEQDSDRQVLHLVTTFRSRRRRPVDWPATFLRNTSGGPLPHFSGTVRGAPVDFALPPIRETERTDQPVVTEIDFEVPPPEARP